MRGRDEPSYEDEMSVRNEVKQAWRQCNGRVRAGAAYVNLALASLEGDDGAIGILSRALAKSPDGSVSKELW